MFTKTHSIVVVQTITAARSPQNAEECRLEGKFPFARFAPAWTAKGAAENAKRVAAIPTLTPIDEASNCVTRPRKMISSSLRTCANGTLALEYCKINTAAQWTVTHAARPVILCVVALEHTGCPRKGYGGVVTSQAAPTLASASRHRAARPARSAPRWPTPRLYPAPPVAEYRCSARGVSGPCRRPLPTIARTGSNHTSFLRQQNKKPRSSEKDCNLVELLYVTAPALQRGLNQ